MDSIELFLQKIREFYKAPNDYIKSLHLVLKKLCVEEVYSKGRIDIAGFKVLGKGWSSIVVAAKTCRGASALKILSPRSRRKSLLREALFAVVASWANIAPAVLDLSPLVIAYGLIDGPLLAEYEPAKRSEKIFILSRLLWKAYKLDVLGISHNELARPEKQVIISKSSLEPYIIDYESATFNENPSNLTQLVGGLIRIKWIRNYVNSLLPELKELLRSYKKERSTTKKYRLYSKILGKILSSL